MSLPISRAARVCALLLLPVAGAPLIAAAPATAQIAVGVSVNVAPPALPVYVQPALPAPGYIWTPGYWSWDPVGADYYWVPGAWVAPPRVGLLWTPGYWGWVNGAYLFHAGYWGPTVGFYGGVNYGFGYNGGGYWGGQWRGGQFYYNTAVSNVHNVNVTNVYNRTVVVNNNTTRSSFNGGPNGVAAKPTPAQLAAANAPHVAPTAAQTRQFNMAKADPQARFSANQGKPPTAAAGKPAGSPPGGGAPGAENRAEREHPAMERPGMQHPAMERPMQHPPAQRAAMGHPMPRMAPHPGPRPAPACHGPHCR